jgi:hypothetical protein
MHLWHEFIVGKLGKDNFVIGHNKTLAACGSVG